MPLYCKFEDVRLRLIGKVRFTENDDEENKMHVALARKLINEAEAEVESDLSPRYAAPFQTDSGQPFASLPERPTKQILRTLAELKSVMRILETDFGVGTAAQGDKYYKAIQSRYKSILDDKLLKSRDDDGLNWVYPPLPSLRLGFHNAAADHGFAGEVIHTSDLDGIGDFPRDRINSPSETYWNVTEREVDQKV